VLPDVLFDVFNGVLSDRHTEALRRITDEYDKKVEAEQAQQRVLGHEKEGMVCNVMQRSATFLAHTHYKIH
jgi:hypothetical protein